MIGASLPETLRSPLLKVGPTLIIGWGGIGREVLLRIRRRFFLSGYPQQPGSSSLWIDTTSRQIGERFTPALPRYNVTRKKSLQGDEICDLRMQLL